MKIMLSQFKKMCQDNNYKRYILNSEDNPEISNKLKITFNCIYNCVDVFFSPDAIVLKNADSVICLGCIRSVSFLEIPCGRGDLYEITCSLFEKCTKYRIYAQK